MGGKVSPIVDVGGNRVSGNGGLEEWTGARGTEGDLPLVPSHPSHLIDDMMR